MPEILSSTSCILLMILESVVPVHLPRFSISGLPSVFAFLYCFYSHFQGLDNLIHFLHLLAIFWISLSGLYISSAKASTTFISLNLRFFSCVSSVLKYPGLAITGWFGSGGTTLPLVLLIVFLHWPLVFWVWGFYRVRSQFLSLSLLDGSPPPISVSSLIQVACGFGDQPVFRSSNLSTRVLSPCMTSGVLNAHVAFGVLEFWELAWPLKFWIVEPSRVPSTWASWFPSNGVGYRVGVFYPCCGLGYRTQGRECCWGLGFLVQMWPQVE